MKLNVCRAVLLAVSMGAALAAPAGVAAPVFVDLGDSGQPTPASENYNHIFVNDTTGPLPDLTNPFDDVLVIANLIDNTGAATGIALDVTPQASPKNGFFKGSNTSGTTAPTGAAAIFHAQATRDNAFGHAAAFGTNPLTPQSELRFTGLNPSMVYNFTFFGSRTGVSDIREAKYTVTGSNSLSALLDASNNTSNVANVLGILPTGAGGINVLVEPGPNNNNASKFYYLGALRLECVPEPASGTLLMLGAVGVFMWQRNRGAGRRS